MSVLEVSKLAIKHLTLYICCFVIASFLYSFFWGITPMFVGLQLELVVFTTINTFITLSLILLIFVAPICLIPYVIILLSIKKYTLGNWYNYAIGAGILPLLVLVSFLFGVFGVIVCVAIFFVITFKTRVNHYYVIALLTMLPLVVSVLSIIYGSKSDNLIFVILYFFPIGVVTGVIYWWLEQKFILKTRV